LVDTASQIVNNAIESSRKRQAKGENAVVSQTFESLASKTASRSYGESFDAANEARLKSKKGKFDDTGLVAAVCRHDRALFLVNMKEAGEKQYYMFAILDKLFQEIPSGFTVGFLHDLACQYHRSMMKVRMMLHFTILLYCII
jgi:hypothetical protein